MRMVAEGEAPAQVFQWVCMACGQAGRDMTVANCPHDGGVLDLRYEPAEIALQPQLPGIWRYAARLPVIDAKHIVSLGEGDTPLLSSSQLGPGIGFKDSVAAQRMIADKPLPMIEAEEMLHIQPR